MLDRQVKVFAVPCKHHGHRRCTTLNCFGADLAQHRRPDHKLANLIASSVRLAVSTTAAEAVVIQAKWPKKKMETQPQ